MDTGEHDIVIPSPGWNETSSLGGPGPGIQSTSNTSGMGAFSNDLLDLLGGSSGTDLFSPTSTFTQPPQSQPVLSGLEGFGPSSFAGAGFPGTMMAQPRGNSMNGGIHLGTPSPFELLPGQFFPLNFFSLPPSEQLSSLWSRAEQDGIMSGAYSSSPTPHSMPLTLMDLI